jgi:hypothetical protein
MTKTRRVGRLRGGSGLRIPNSVLKTLYNRKTAARGLKKAMPTKRAEMHPNLTNANMENLHVVNTNTDEWRIKPGNRNNYIPKNLRPPPRIVQYSNMGPGVRVFHTKLRPEQMPKW